MVVDELGEPVGIPARRIVYNVQGAAEGEMREIGEEGVGYRDIVQGNVPEIAALASEEPCLVAARHCGEVAVLDQDSFGPTRAARGVDDIREVVGEARGQSSVLPPGL